jgi:hypothetical protein
MSDASGGVEQAHRMAREGAPSGLLPRARPRAIWAQS